MECLVGIMELHLVGMMAAVIIAVSPGFERSFQVIVVSVPK
jgi:hypothetical protein